METMDKVRRSLSRCVMTRFFRPFLGIAFLNTAVAAAPEKAPPIVSGAELQKLFADAELGDGAHYAYRFKSDGSIAGTEMGKDVRGTWRTTARQFCWTWSKPPGSEECYEVRRQDSDVHFFRNGYEASSGTLTPVEVTKRTR